MVDEEEVVLFSFQKEHKGGDIRPLLTLLVKCQPLFSVAETRCSICMLVGGTLKPPLDQWDIYLIHIEPRVVYPNGENVPVVTSQGCFQETNMSCKNSNGGPSEGHWGYSRQLASRWGA
ncbi:hypothetical protein CIPAW_06G024900 [Carya illinoinensis]|uniref:Uncharacterized protein n=1 Tax=Carya illinoinensis TaxID=32201 RepID=A0A8T1Q702_CARIL|nr:hypothetical protein CIPAW_06G024900 [Carya illinoinensis]